MRYPIVQYRNNEAGSTSSFRGLNRCDRGNGGEWLDCMDIDTGHYPCLAPRKEHGKVCDSVDGKIRLVCEPLRNNGSYNGFTGIIYTDAAVTGVNEDGKPQTAYNCCFCYNGEIMSVGAVTSDADEKPERTALWIYDSVMDGVSEEDIAGLEIERVEWSAAYINGRIAINGYDPVLKRGKYFVFEIDKDDESRNIVIPSGNQYTFEEIGMGYRSGIKAGYDEYSHIGYFGCNKKFSAGAVKYDFSEYFNEGDVLMIEVDTGSEGYDESWDRLNVYPYRKESEDGKYLHSKRAKYAVVREIVNEYDDEGTLKMSRVYYYASSADGKLYHPSALYSDGAKVSGISGVNATIGIYVPTMSHISGYAGRVWGVNEEEDSVYASVFDTPLKIINTDAQLDMAMSWQVELSTSDSAVGVISAVSEMLVLKKNSLIRIGGTSAFSFAITGVFKNCGCIDIRSAVEVTGAVYYLGYNGFYMYDGSQPQIISAKLNRSYKSAVAFTDGNKYYAYATATDGETELLVYDIRYNIWHKWSVDGSVTGAFRCGDKLYMCGESEIYPICTEAEVQEWSCESVEHWESVNDAKGVNALYVRAFIADDAMIEFATRSNGGEWMTHEVLEPKGRAYVYKIPVRISPGDFWQYRLRGSGTVVIHNIERAYAEGGRKHSGNR